MSEEVLNVLVELFGEDLEFLLFHNRKSDHVSP